MYSRVGGYFLDVGGALGGFWQRKLAFLVGRRGEGEGLIPCGTRLLGKKVLTIERTKKDLYYPQENGR